MSGASGRIGFVIDRVELNGGNKQIFLHAQLLAESGFNVTVLGNDPRPDWTRFNGRYVDLSASKRADYPMLDLCIFTYFTSFRQAASLRFNKPAHFCQGFEKFAPHLAGFDDEIDAFYRAVPDTLCISDGVAEICRSRYGKRCFRVEPVVEGCFRPGLRWPWRARARILVPGIFEMPTKGVPLALAAVAQVAAGRSVELYRLSTFRRSEQEAALYPSAHWIQGRSPLQVAALMRRMDLVVTLPTEQEGFGLPALEAIASGIPVICSPTLAYAPLLSAGAARTAATADLSGYAAEIADCLANAEKWRQMRAACAGIALRYRGDSQRVRTANAVSAMLE